MRRCFMMKRQIFPWMGFLALVAALTFHPDLHAKELYKVKRGDTLAKISQKTGVRADALKKANRLSSRALKRNQVLVIPHAGKTSRVASRKAPTAEPVYYVVKKGDTLHGIAKRNHLSALTLKKMNGLRTSSLRAGQRIVVARKTPAPAEAKRDALPPPEEELAEEEGDLDETLEGEGEIDSFGTDGRPANPGLVGEWNSLQERRLFVRVVRGFLGAPYCPGGSSVRGLGCSAFVQKVYEFFDVELPGSARAQSRLGACADRDALEEGDLVFFNTKRALDHVGIYVGKNEFIHASARDRTVRVDRLDSAYYNARFAKAVRLKELNGGTPIVRK
jgi:peptidoglycan DL-endopeptidase LytE